LVGSTSVAYRATSAANLVPFGAILVDGFAGGREVGPSMMDMDAH
jgi:hypothetical protein